MSEEEIIVCTPTKWFFWRAIAMVAMFGVFCGLFLKDWKIGYPKKNVVYFNYKAFEKAKEAFKQNQDAFAGAADPERAAAEEWNVWAPEQTIGYPEEEGVLPPGVDPQEKWPAMLTNYESYKKVFDSAEGSKAIPPLWARYSDEKGWESSAPEKSYDKGKINEQLYFGIGSGGLFLVGLFFLIRTSRRSIKVDQDAFYGPAGQNVPFSSIRRIDKRKWETKGLAHLYFEDGGEQKKVKVDGMVYGQFKPEDGAPAEKLFQRILDNFTGELVELEDDEEEEEEEGADESGGEEAGEDARE